MNLDHIEAVPGGELNCLDPKPCPSEDEMGSSRSRRGGRLPKFLFFAVKLLISSVCFWFVLRQINVSDSARALEALNLRWTAFAVLVAMMRIPLLALRLQAIVLELVPPTARLTYLAANIVTAICSLFTQIMPNVVGEAARAWMLTRFGCEWRFAFTSVILDRCAGIAVFVVFAFTILLLPSVLTATSSYHNFILCAVGAVLMLGLTALLLTPRLAPLLERWRYSYWIGTFAKDAHRIFVGSRSPEIIGAACLINVLTIVIIWSVGRAQGLALPPSDCAVLFVVMVGVVLIPISAGGWGLRELAVVSLLGAHGFAPERALLISVCFGLVVAISVLPGAVALLFYPMPRAASNKARW